MNSCRKKRHLLFGVVAFAGFLAACPAENELLDAGASNATPLDAGGAQTDADAGFLVGVDAGMSSCVLNGFDVEDGNYLTTSAGDFALLYDGNTGEMRKVQLEMYGLPRTPADYELLGENFDACTVCLSFLDGCAGQQGDCERHFLAQSGTLSLTSYDDTTLEGTLLGIEAVEVTIDANFTSTAVEGGEGWCLDSLSFSLVVEQ